jgi:hypothetical protein
LLLLQNSNVGFVNWFTISGQDALFALNDTIDKNESYIPDNLMPGGQNVQHANKYVQYDNLQLQIL